MKQSTVKKYIEFLLEVKSSGETLKTFCKNTGKSYNAICVLICNLKKQHDKESEDVKYMLNLYDEVVGKKVDKTINDIVEDVETDDRAETSYIRDDNGKIKFYSYQIFRKNKAPLSGKLTREEMNTIHRLYSYYGDSLTQRVISRHFVDLSLIDFKRILRAFNITKASAPFAPHMFEELGEQELRDIQLREKENSFLRKAEEDIVKNNEKLLKRYAQENIDLKATLKNSTFTVNVNNIEVPKIETTISNNRVLNLYLSDMHIGASINSAPIYKENINYGRDEIIRRLKVILNNITSFGEFSQINLVLLGDNIDCCGIFGKTARLDHDMPENMDPREQANVFLDIMFWFVGALRNLKSKINVYSVPCGNHSGNFEYVCNKALFNGLNACFNDVKTTLWEEYYGVFEVNNAKFICMHGKDFLFMKRPMPLDLNDKTHVLLYEWLDSQNIQGNNIHFIKGDLHSNSLSSCRKFTYRNVLSLFGASDYSNMNYSRNSYGLSYDIIDGDNLLRGTFENV